MRTATFIDGQNLYHLAKNAWSSHPSDRYGWPSYDIGKLSTALVQRAFGCALSQIHFYTGVPSTGPWHRCPMAATETALQDAMWPRGGPGMVRWLQAADYVGILVPEFGQRQRDAADSHPDATLIAGKPEEASPDSRRSRQPRSYAVRRRTTFRVSGSAIRRHRQGSNPRAEPVSYLSRTTALCIRRIRLTPGRSSILRSTDRELRSTTVGDCSS